MEREFDVIELENGSKYIVIDAVNYNNHTYLLLGKLNSTEDDMDNKMLVYEKIDNKVVVIEDNDLLEKLIKTFENRVGIN